MSDLSTCTDAQLRDMASCALPLLGTAPGHASAEEMLDRAVAELRVRYEKKMAINLERAQS